MKKKVLILYENDVDKEKIKYVFDFIFGLPLNKYEVVVKYCNLKDFKEENTEKDIVINYSNEKIAIATVQIVVKDILQSLKSYQDVLKLKSQFYTFENEKLYGITKCSKSEKIKFIDDGTINLDVVSTFFFHLSRTEEYYCSDDLKDGHKRMLAESQFLVKNSIERLPVLDHISAALLKSIDFYKEIKTMKIMSHDIDVLIKFPSFYKYLRGVARILFKKKNFKGSIFTFTKYYLKSLIGAPDPFDTFSWLFHENFFDKKIVFFMSGGTTQYDNLYDIEDPTLKKVFKNALNKGYEIGLHPSYAAFNDEKQFVKEKKRLEGVIQQKITSSRQHILHYDITETPKVLEESGIENDYTLGFQDRIGFRTGTGFDYYLWNNLKNKRLDVKETPLVIMDGCLLIEAKYSVKKAEEIFNEFYKNNALNTKITYNFHNSIFDPVLLDDTALKHFYLKL